MKKLFFAIYILFPSTICFSADWTTVSERTTGISITGSLRWSQPEPMTEKVGWFYYKDPYLPLSFEDADGTISVGPPYQDGEKYGTYPALGHFYISVFPTQAEREKNIQDELLTIGNQPEELALFNQASPGSVARYCSQYTGVSSTYTYVRGKGKPGKTNIPYDVRQYCQIMGPESDPCEENPQDCKTTDYYKTPQQIWEHRFVIPKFPPEFFQPKGYCPKNAYFLIHLRLLRFKDPEYLAMDKKTQQDLEEENKKILESFKSLKWHFPE